LEKLEFKNFSEILNDETSYKVRTNHNVRFFFDDLKNQNINEQINLMGSLFLIEGLLSTLRSPPLPDNTNYYARSDPPHKIKISDKMI